MHRVEGSESIPQSPTVFLHIGAPKTGTTFLQEVLWHNRARLAGDGVLYPGDRPGHQFYAAQDLRGIRFHGHENPAVPGSWEQLASRARSWRGRAVVISHEILAWSTEDDARRAVDSLRPARVRVVFTARDLVRQIPAVWQESVKNRRVVGFHRYLQSLQAPQQPGPWGKVFWGAQDAIDVLRRWSAAVPPEDIHVVTVPPSGGSPGALWQRFAGLAGVDPTRYETDLGGSNVSLGRAEVELLRRVNRKIDRDTDWPTYERLFKSGLAETTLAGRTGGQKIVLPDEWRPWAVEQSQRLAEGLARAGYPVVGDLDELVPPATTTGEASQRLGPDAVLEVAAETLAELVQQRTPAGPGRIDTVRHLARSLYRRMMVAVRGYMGNTRS